MKIVSLFDGMACGMLAMLGAGVEVDEYYAYEIDKYAIQTATHNFPNIIECGDVFKADFTQYEDVDFIVGGSPCTYWSIAQKNNRETEASGLGWELFSQYVRALNEIKPRFFIYENNKSMSKAIRDSITETFGFDAICINSALVSAQNRQRLYWVGKRNEDGTYSKVDVQQPADRGILLKDILDSGMDLTSRDKSFAYTTRCNSAIPEDTIKRNRHTMVAEPICTASEGKSHTLKAQYYKNGMANFITNGGFPSSAVTASATALANKVGAMPRPNGELSQSQGFRIYDINGKSVTLKGNAGGAGGKTGLYAMPIEFENGVPTKAISCSDSKTYTVYSVSNGAITIKGKEYPIKLQDGYYIIRKLSVNECKKLQTVPEDYEFPVSNAQAYKLLGNGWSVEVIIHLIKSCFGEVSNEKY